MSCSFLRLHLFCQKSKTMTTQLNEFFPLLRDKETGRLSIRKILGIPILSYLTWQATSQFIKIDAAVFFDSKTTLQFFLDGHFLVFIVVFGLIIKATYLFSVAFQVIFIQMLSARIKRKIREFGMTEEQYSEKCKTIAEKTVLGVTEDEIRLVPAILRDVLNKEGWRSFSDAVEKARLKLMDTTLFFIRLLIALSVYVWGNSLFSWKGILPLLLVPVLAICAEGLTYIFMDILPLIIKTFLKAISGFRDKSERNILS